MTDEIHKALFVSLTEGGRNEMSSFHYVNFAGSLLHLVNCYSICRWTLPTRSPQIWHTVITCPIFLCCMMSSTAHRNTAHKAETKVPEEFNLPKVISVSSFQARICKTHCCPFGPVAQTKQVHYCLLTLAFTFGATELAMELWAPPDSGDLPGSGWNQKRLTQPMRAKGNMLSTFNEIQLIEDLLENTSITKVPPEVIMHNYSIWKSPFASSTLSFVLPFLFLLSFLVNIKLYLHLFDQEYFSSWISV